MQGQITMRGSIQEEKSYLEKADCYQTQEALSSTLPLEGFTGNMKSRVWTSARHKHHTTTELINHCSWELPTIQLYIHVPVPGPSAYVHCQRGGAVSGKQRIGWKGLVKRRGRGSQHIRRELAKHPSNVVVPIASSAQKVLFL